MRRIIPIAIPLLLALPALSCRNTAGPEAPPDSSPAKAQDPPASPEASPAKKMLPKHNTEKQEIMVGGCRDACAAPKDAFRSFIRTLFGVMPEGNPELTRYFDTTMLVDNGKRLGDEWADLWFAGKLDSRRNSIADWVKGYQARVGTLAGIPSDVDGALEAGMQFRRLSSETVEIELVPPARNGSSNSERWKFVLGLRGLEWLIQEIYD